MDFQTTLFFLLSAVLLAAAVATVTRTNLVHAALALILAFFTAAMQWLLLEAEFLAVLLVLVYVGAVLVLFLFVVMMMEHEARVTARVGYYRSVALLVAGVMLLELLAVLTTSGIRLDPPVPRPVGTSNTRELGAELFVEHLLAFEAAGLILLIAIVGAIGLALRSRPQHRRQSVSQQVRASKAERLRLVDADGKARPPC